ncbi:MAG: recombination mediator RecR [Bacilli bacterium]|nr:recombination mediator RecR [Bacilli bacterium]
MKELKSINRLVESYSRLPSVGKKSAERMAYATLNMDEENIKEFAEALLDLKKKIKFCPKCGLYIEDDHCEICEDPSRDQQTVIVLSYAKDVYNFEKLNSYHGVYHVLNGVISAIKGVGADDLNIPSLIKRIDNENIKEVIIATDPTVEGETTALYLAKLLEGKNVTITRLAYGLPMGGHIDYADSLTIMKALEGRKKI